MKFLVNKEIKILFFVYTAILLVSMILGQIIVKLISDDYKQSIIKHDYGVAGYLLQNGSDKAQVAKAFTKDKTSDNIKIGSDLLQAAGYKDNIRNSLLPEVSYFHQKYAVILFIFFIFLSAMILVSLLFFLLRQDKRIKKANEDIQAFMDGNIYIRLDDQEEGSLPQLFTSINGMATSLMSHIIDEKQGREFLKDTISDISHQLKTPLAALKMYNEIIQNEQIENSVVEEFIFKSDRELNRMEALIQSLLKLARLDTSSIELEKCEHNLKDFLENAIQGFYTRAKHENKSVQLDCDESISMSFDEEWILEAISNIIKNAMDHTTAGSKIEIKCEETPTIMEISIKDNGTGIHPEDIHSIFKRFYRSRFSKDKQGIGIGLTLSKMIIEKHDGSIIVESELGKGTAFHLTFPKLSNL